MAGRKIAIDGGQFVTNQLTDAVSQIGPLLKQRNEKIRNANYEYNNGIKQIRNNSLKGREKFREKQKYLETLEGSAKGDQGAMITFYQKYFTPVKHDGKAFLLFDGGNENNFWIKDDENGKPTVYKYDFKTKKETAHPGEYNVVMLQQKAWVKQLLDKLEEEGIPYDMNTFRSYYNKPIKFK